MRRATGAWLAAGLVLATAGAARADCGGDEELSVGVVLRRCESEGLRWSELSADLAAPDVGVRVAVPSERGQTVEAWAAGAEGAVAAIPGGAFRFADFEPEGLTVGESVPWADTVDDPRRAVLALSRTGAGLVVPAEQVVPVEAWMDDVVSGVPVLRDGVPEPCRDGGCEPAPRAAVGLSADRRTLVAVAVEGWTAASAGVSDAELGALLRDAGAQDGLRVAAGATSVLWARGEAVVPSSDGASRAGAAYLGVVDRSRGATGQLVGVVERMGDGAPLPEATIAVETTDGRVVATGGTATDNAYFSFELPARGYVVRASLPGHRTSCRYCVLEPAAEKWCSHFLSEGDGMERCEPPPRGVDAGPWPVGDAGGPGVDGGGGEPPTEGDCAAAPGSGASPGFVAALLTGAWLARRRRRDRR
ncbi:MAG TPA: phosphodiester glycosidase family protein [Sandaracinaceae bacterium LLY-WYZ-13_1]|nr:phosphodiester glycosidase family protein [Sandaracinaceae bacterium LLY-WYZ-13_1]